METKWENGKLWRTAKINHSYNQDPERAYNVYSDITHTLTIPELEQAVIDNHLTVYQALNLAYLLGQRVK